MNSKLNRKIYFISQAYRKEPVRAAYKELSQSLYFTRTELNTIQNNRVKDILVHVINEVPYYQRKFYKFKSDIIHLPISEMPELMAQLPVLKKEDVIKDRLSFFSKKTFKTHTNISSGTTGEPFSFPCDQISWAYRHASIIRCLEYHGVQFGSRYGYFFGQHWKSELKWKTLLKDEFFNRNRFSAFDITHESVTKKFNQFIKNKAEYFFGYPSTIMEFCQICENELGLEPRRLGLKLVMATGETLELFQKKYLETKLNCPVINYYGSAEGGAGAFEGKDGLMYENMETTFVEKNKDNKLIKTDLFLRQFPLIKIQTDDVCIPIVNEEPHILSHHTVGTISGRTGDKIRLPNGEKVHAVVLDYFFDLFLDNPNVSKFRFEFRDDSVNLLIENKLENIEDSFKKKIKFEFNTLFPKVGIKISKVEKIPSLANGKNRPWIQL